MTHSTVSPQRRLSMTKRLLLSATALVAAGVSLATSAGAGPALIYSTPGPHNDAISLDDVNAQQTILVNDGVQATYAGAITIQGGATKAIEFGNASEPNSALVFSPSSIVTNSPLAIARVFSGKFIIGSQAARDAFSSGDLRLQLWTGTLDLAGASQAFANISTLPQSNILNSTAGTTTSLTIMTDSRPRTLDGTISNGAGVVALDIRGSGQVDMRGNNSYSGGTSVIGAIAVAHNSNALGVGAISLLTTQTRQTTLQLNNGVVLSNSLNVDGSGSVDLQVLENNTGTLTGNISGNAGIRKYGGGILQLEGHHLGSGRVQITQGTLVAAASGPGPGAIGNMSTVEVARNATLRVMRTEAIGHLVGAGTVDIADSVSELVVGMDDLHASFEGSITGVGALRKTGQGAFALMHAGTLSGRFTLQQGTLAVWATDALGSSALWTGEDTRVILDGGVRLDNNVTLENGNFGVEVRDGEIATLGGSVSRFDAVGDNRLGKYGDGTLIFAGSSLDASQVDVWGGTLQVDGTLNTHVAVEADATLTGRGTIDGNVQIEDAGVLAGRSGDRLTVSGDLMLNDDSRVNVSLGSPSSAALFEVGGDLWLSGQLTIADAGGFGQGVYRLFNYGGALNDAGLDIVGAPAGVPLQDISLQTAFANQVNLVVAGNGPGPTPDIQFWDGGNTTPDGRISGGSGTWNASSTNWTDANGQVNGAWGGRFAVFQGEEGLVTVDSGATPIAITGMQFASDGYTVTGGSLALTASDTVIRVGDGTENGERMRAIIGSSLTGSGRLVKDDLGALVLEGSNSYAGDTIVRNGWLVGNTASIRNNLINHAGVTFNQNVDGIFSGAVEGTGLTAKDGTGTLALAGRSTTDWQVRRGVLVSQAGLFRGDAEIVDLGTLRFQQAETATYQGVLSGAGKFDIAGQGNARVMLTADSSGFAGETSISSGELAVNGKLGGYTKVRSGGRLSGTGTLSMVGVEAGGTHGPGNSIGTQTILGTYANRGTLQVDVSPAGTDKLVVGGGVDIGGATLELLMSSAPIAEWNTGPLTLIQNDSRDAIVGQFAGVINPFAFLSQSLNYAGGDGNDLMLQLSRNAVKFADAGKTLNQIAVGKALDGMPASSPLVGRVALLSQADARAGFDQLSGEVHASAKTALIDDSAHIRTAVNDRIRAAFEGVAAKAAPVMAYGPDGGEFDTASTDRFAVWGHAFGSWSDVDGDGNAAKLEHSTGGVLFGGDALVAETVRLGLMAGYTQSNFSIDQRASSGSSDNAHLGVYAGAKVGRVAIRGGVAYAWHDIETTRRVSFAGLSEQLKSSYDAGTFQAFGEAGYRIDTAFAAFEPFAGLAYVSLRSDAFTETGGVSALTAKSETSGVGFTTLGLRASTDFRLGAMAATVRGTLGWRHAFGDVTPLSAQAFAASQPFTIAGVPIGRDSAIVEAALDLDLSARATLGVAYHGQLSGNAQDHGIKAQLGVKF